MLRRYGRGTFHRLSQRERDGRLKCDFSYEWGCIFKSLPSRFCVPLSTIDPNHMLYTHIILGFTRDGRHLLSYTHVFPAQYTLFVWRFDRPLTLIFTVSLFFDGMHSSISQPHHTSTSLNETDWFSVSPSTPHQMLIRVVHSPEYSTKLNNSFNTESISLLITHAQPWDPALMNSQTSVRHYVTIIPWFVKGDVQVLRKPVAYIHITYESFCDELWEPEIMFQYPLLLFSVALHHSDSLSSLSSFIIFATLFDFQLMIDLHSFSRGVHSTYFY
jgi:hypothetical protein